MSIYIGIKLSLRYHTLLALPPDEFPWNRASRLALGKSAEIRYNAMHTSNYTP
jgi:hypothetical protein